ncbi:type IV pilin [Halorussus marinus]|uniref:type IV pilin n=1 Tax=Halorussus marinus TaxID=2505976 RepID=UPI00106EE3EF|nr:type IV pilin [Halorussus marinus]
MSPRAVSPVLGVVCLLVVTVVLAAAVGTAALGTTLPTDRPTAAVDLRVDAGADRLALVHRAGEALDVRALSVRILIDGDPLDRQPPVPFFSARGFVSGPTGPFNPAADPRWSVGERASLRIAGTNAPTIAPGERVAVEFLVEGVVVAEASARA